jgi:cell division protein FtsL
MATARVTNRATKPVEVEKERSRHLRVVRPESRRLRITPRTGVVLTVSLFGALFGVAVSHAMLIESQMDLEQLDERASSEQARYERLRLDVAQLESPDRIVREAQDRLGMVPADDVVWLTPDQPAPADEGDGNGDGRTGDTGTGGTGEDGDAPDTPATSWADIKPYLEPAP